MKIKIFVLSLVLLIIGGIGFSQYFNVIIGPHASMGQEYFDSSDRIFMDIGGQVISEIVLGGPFCIQMGGSMGINLLSDNPMNIEMIINVFLGFGYYFFINDFSSFDISLCVHGGFNTWAFDPRYGGAASVKYQIAIDGEGALNIHIGAKAIVDFFAIENSGITDHFLWAYSGMVYLGVTLKFVIIEDTRGIIR